MGKDRSAAWQYAAALVATGLAVLVRWLLDPWLGGHLPLATLYGAVALAAWFGGYRPALAAAALGYLACDYLFIEPRGAFGFGSARNLIGLFFYLLSCGIIVGFGEAMRSARRDAEAGRDRLGREADERRRAEQLLDDFFRSAPFGIALLDGRMRYVRVNGVLAGMNGLPAEDHVGRAVGEVVPGLLAAATAVFDEVMKSGRAAVGKEFEGELPHAPGVRRWWDESWFPVPGPGGRPVGVGVVVREVTDRKRDEADLRAGEERLRLAARATGVTLFEQDAGLRYLWLHNPIAGYTAEGLVGRTDEEIEHTVEDLPALVRAKREVLATGRGVRVEVVNRVGGGPCVLPRHPGAEARRGGPGGRAARGGPGRDRPAGAGGGPAGERGEVLDPVPRLPGPDGVVHARRRGDPGRERGVAGTDRVRPAGGRRQDLPRTGPGGRPGGAGGGPGRVPAARGRPQRRDGRGHPVGGTHRAGQPERRGDRRPPVHPFDQRGRHRPQAGGGRAAADDGAAPGRHRRHGRPRDPVQP